MGPGTSLVAAATNARGPLGPQSLWPAGIVQNRWTVPAVRLACKKEGEPGRGGLDPM